MNLSNYRKCDKCGELFDAAPFHNMCADGESAYSSIKIYGDRYDSCPKCTREFYDLIKGKQVFDYGKCDC